MNIDTQHISKADNQIDSWIEKLLNFQLLTEEEVFSIC
jgi:hypothetical protein